jgi:hypothetical protein
MSNIDHLCGPVTWDNPYIHWLHYMPRYHFDLVDSEIVADHGGLLLRDDAHAIEVGERLAKKLYESRPDLRGRHCSILVRDQHGEMHRALIEELKAG